MEKIKGRMVEFLSGRHHLGVEAATEDVDDLFACIPELKQIAIEMGAKIKSLRSDRGWSRKNLAAKLGVTHQQISKYEKGENRISAPRLAVGIKEFNIKSEEFFDDTVQEVSGDERKFIAAVKEMKKLNPKDLATVSALIDILKD